MTQREGNDRTWWQTNTFKFGLGTVCVILAFLASLKGGIEARWDAWVHCGDIPSDMKGWDEPEKGEGYIAYKLGAPHVCVDLANIKWKDMREVRTAINKFAEDRTKWDVLPDSGELGAELNPQFGETTASIVPARGARDLKPGDLARRGRIVAKIVTGKPYKHGIVRTTTYVWVDKGPFRGYRVLMIPKDIREPISVLSDAKITFREHKHYRKYPWPWSRQQSPFIMSASNAQEQFETLSQGAKNCLDPDPERKDEARKLACWVHSAAGGKAKANAYDASDGWVWVEDWGCVCIGSKCHDLYVG